MTSDNAAFYLDAERLEAGMGDVRQSPRDLGRVDVIVIRPNVDERMVLPAVEVDVEEGLAGDTWRTRGSRNLSLIHI